MEYIKSEKIKKDKEEAELALQNQREIYEIRLQEAMDSSLNISTLSLNLSPNPDNSGLFVCLFVC